MQIDYFDFAAIVSSYSFTKKNCDVISIFFTTISGEFVNWTKNPLLRLESFRHRRSKKDSTSLTFSLTSSHLKARPFSFKSVEKFWEMIKLLEVAVI